jgi:hypothetical protein
MSCLRRSIALEPDQDLLPDEQLHDANHDLRRDAVCRGHLFRIRRPQARVTKRGLARGAGLLLVRRK